MKWYLISILIYISFITNEYEYLFICYRDICVSSSLKHTRLIFYSCFNMLFFFLKLISGSSLHILLGFCSYMDYK